MRLTSTEGAEVRLHRLVEAPGERRLLVAHATGFHGRAYGPFARCLRGFDVWAPDLRGHGDALVPESIDFNWEGLADDLAVVVEALADGPPLFAFGHSMGGAVAMLTEARRPGTFRGIWTWEPIVHPPDLERDPERHARFVEGTRKRRRTFSSLEEAIANFAAKPPFDVFDPECLRAYLEHGFHREADGSLRIKMEPEHESRMYTMSASHPTWNRLPEVGCPVVVAAGREAEGPARVAPLIAARLPRGRFERYDDLDHMGPFEAPGRVAERVQAFCDAIEPATAVEAAR